MANVLVLTHPVLPHYNPTLFSIFYTQAVPSLSSISSSQISILISFLSVTDSLRDFLFSTKLADIMETHFRSPLVHFPGVKSSAAEMCKVKRPTVFSVMSH